MSNRGRLQQIWRKCLQDLKIWHQLDLQKISNQNVLDLFMRHLQDNSKCLIVNCDILMGYWRFQGNDRSFCKFFSVLKNCCSKSVTKQIKILK